MLNIIGNTLTFNYKNNGINLGSFCFIGRRDKIRNIHVETNTNVYIHTNYNLSLSNGIGFQDLKALLRNSINEYFCMRMC